MTTEPPASQPPEQPVSQPPEAPATPPIQPPAAQPAPPPSQSATQPVEQPAAQPTPPPAAATQTQSQPQQSIALPVPLQAGEQVIRLCRRHWWFLWPWTLWLIVVTIVPPMVAAAVLDRLGILDNLGLFATIPAVLWIGYWGFRAIFNWYRYQNDIWIVTNQRIIDSFRSNPFNKRVSTADLVNLQDINVQKRGLTSTMLNYGDVVCQTASSGEGFVIGGVPNPEDLQLLLDAERDRERNRISSL